MKDETHTWLFRATLTLMLFLGGVGRGLVSNSSCFRRAAASKEVKPFLNKPFNGCWVISQEQRMSSLLAVWPQRDLTAETQRILSSGAGGSVGAARPSFFSHQCWDARGLEDLVDASLHQLGNQGHATDRRKSLLITMELTNGEYNSTTYLQHLNQLYNWKVLMLYPISTTASRKTPKTWFNSGNMTVINWLRCLSIKQY